MELTKEQIDKINKECPYSYDSDAQGIFKEPTGIPDKIKTPVVYMRWETGGVSGGSCWDSSDPRPYTKNDPKPKFVVLDMVLKELMPDISYLQYKEVENLIHSSEKTDWEYYGNCTEYSIEYVVVDDLIKLLKSFKDK